MKKEELDSAREARIRARDLLLNAEHKLGKHKDQKLVDCPQCKYGRGDDA